MKRSFFPILFAAVVLLTASCIKNTESDGVKAVRMGQAALLTAQATATTTLATANATLLTAQAAVQTAMATVQTANAKYTDALSAQEAANTAGIVEQNRHNNAMNVILETLRTAQSKTAIAQAVNALAEETAMSAVRLAQIADQKVNIDSQLALDKLQATMDLDAKNLALATAKLNNTTALAQATWANDLALAQLKDQKLNMLAAQYDAANAAYLSTLAEIQVLQNQIQANKNMQIAYTSSPYLYTVGLVGGVVTEVLWNGKTFVSSSGQNVTGPVMLADSGDVKIARKTLADAITNLKADYTDKTASAQANDDAAKALVTYWTNLRNGTATTAKATADDAIAKRDAEANTYQQLNLNWEVLNNALSNPDIYGTYGTWTKANAAVTAANTELAAKLALLTPAIIADSAKAYYAFNVNANVADNVQGWLNTALANGQYAWTVEPVGVPATVAYANSVAIQNILYPAPVGGWAPGSPQAIGLANATTTYNWALAKYNTILTDISKIRADITTANNAKVAADAAFKTLNDVKLALIDQVAAALALKMASNERITWYNNLIVWINGDASTVPPTVPSFTSDVAYVNAQLLLALTKRWGTGATLTTTATVSGTTDGTAAKLATAKSNEAAQKNKIAVDYPAAIVAAILAYKQNVAMNPVNYAYLQVQIDAWTAQIASLNIILGIQKAELTMWTDKVKLALQ